MGRNKRKKPRADGLAALSTRLRNARMSKGFTLPQVANMMHLRQEQVGALEDGDFDAFTAEVFIRGYLRTYAGILDIDADEVVGLYDDTREMPAISDAQVTTPSSSALSRLPFASRYRAIAAAGLALLVVISLLVMLFSANEEETATQVADAQPAVAEQSPLPAVAVPVAEPEPEPAEKTAADAVGEVVEQPVPVAADPRTDQLTIRFRGQCWVEVRDATRKLLLVDMREAGDEEILYGDPPYLVLLGDVSVADVFYQGEKITIPPDQGKKSARVSIGE